MTYLSVREHLPQGNSNRATRLNYGWVGEDDDEDDFDYKSSSINVLGTPMIPCCSNVETQELELDFIVMDTALQMTLIWDAIPFASV